MGFADRWVWAVWEEKVGTVGFKAKECHQTLTSPLNSPCLLPGDASLTNGNTFPSAKMPTHSTDLERRLMVRACFQHPHLAHDHLQLQLQGT